MREEIRKRAASRVLDDESPLVVVEGLGIQRSCIYNCLNQHRRWGEVGLETEPIPGRPIYLVLDGQPVHRPGKVRDFAAAAITKSDPIKTGIQGFSYDIRTAILPLSFAFNTQLLLIGIGNGFELLLVISSAVIAMLLFVVDGSAAQ